MDLDQFEFLVGDLSEVPTFRYMKKGKVVKQSSGSDLKKIKDDFTELKNAWKTNKVIIDYLNLKYTIYLIFNILNFKNL